MAHYTLNAELPIGYTYLLDSNGIPIKDSNDEYIYALSDYSFNLYGFNVEFELGTALLELSAEKAEFTLTGNDVVFDYEPIPNYVLNAELPIGYTYLLDSNGIPIKDSNDEYIYAISDYSFNLYGFNVEFELGVSPITHYNIEVEKADFNLTGNDVSFKIDKNLNTEKAEFTLTGNDVALTKIGDYVINTEKAEFTLTGNDVVLTYEGTTHYTLNAELPIGYTYLLDSNGIPIKDSNDEYIYALSDYSFNLYGFNVEFELGVSPITHYDIDVEKAEFTLTGNDASFKLDKNLNVEKAEFTLTGNDAILTKIGAYVINAEKANFNLIGNDVVLRAIKVFDLEKASFTLAGKDASFKLDKNLITEKAEFTLTGNDAVLIKIGAYTLDANTGSFSLIGKDVTLKAAKNFDVETGNFSLEGSDVFFEVSNKLSANTGNFNLEGNDVVLKADKKFIVETAEFLLEGGETNLYKGKAIICETVEFTLEANDILFKVDKRLSLELAEFALSGLEAELNAGKVLLAETGGFILTSKEVEYTLERALAAYTGVFNLDAPNISFGRTGTYSRRKLIDIAINEKIAYAIINEIQDFYEST